MGDYMSKIAIISDVHANAMALKYVLRDIEKRNVDSIICLGDLVTKYFYPDYVVDLIKGSASIVIKGNCDDLVAKNENYVFARSKLGLSRIEYLSNLPEKAEFALKDIKIQFYHSSPNSLDKLFNPLFKDNDKTPYKNKIIKNYNELFEENNNISIVAHTHQNYIGKEENNALKLVDNIILNNKEKIIVNVGSVGEHVHMVLENGSAETIVDPFLTYALLDTDSLNVEIIKLPYKELLKKVFLDSLYMQDKGLAPYSKEDNKKLRKSLKLM